MLEIPCINDDGILPKLYFFDAFDVKNGLEIGLIVGSIP
jgi:hypothetical protein